MARTIRTYATRYTPAQCPVDARRGPVGEYRAIADWVAMPDGVEGDTCTVLLFRGSASRTFIIANGANSWAVPEGIQTVSSATSEFVIGTGVLPQIMNGVRFGKTDLEGIYPIFSTNTLAEEITSLLSFGWRRFQLMGPCEVESVITLPSNTEIRGQGKTLISTSIVAAYNQADTPSNTLFKTAGSVGVLLGTMTVTTYGGETSVTLDFAPEVGDAIFFRSDYTKTDIYPTGSDVYREEFAYVLGVSGSGPWVVDLDHKLVQVHGAGTQVYSCTPSTNIEITGIQINLLGVTTANGILAEVSSGCLFDVSGVGASRAVVNLRRGSYGNRIIVKRLGGGQDVLLESSHLNHTTLDVDFSECVTNGRTHPNATYGLVRGNYAERERCYHNRVDGITAHGCTGYSLWGANFGKYKVQSRDFLLTERLTREPDLVGMVSSPALIRGGGAGLEIMAVQPNVAKTEIPFGNEIDCELYDCRVSSADGYQGAFFSEDIRGHKISRLVIVNNDRNHNLTGENAVGAVIFDSWDFDVGQLVLKGVSPGITVFGGWCRAHIGEVIWDETNSQGGAPYFMFWGLYAPGFGYPQSTFVIDSLVLISEPTYFLVKMNTAPAVIEESALAIIGIGKVTSHGRPGKVWKDVRFVYDASATANYGLNRGDAMQLRPPIACVVDTGTNVLTSNGHGLINGLAGYLKSTVAPVAGGYTAATRVYVKVLTANTFQLGISANSATVLDWSTTGTDVYFAPEAPTVVIPTSTVKGNKVHIYNGGPHDGTGYGATYSLPIRWYLAAFGEECEGHVGASEEAHPGDLLEYTTGVDMTVNNASTDPAGVVLESSKSTDTHGISIRLR